ncbi:hypothetical protein [Micromonospora sp. CPCC 206061]|uniref:hypothetical protein n=1 Tax=Micromonospora sp. CPCC 206061 TaxID=3122410 RepID=UPI002FF0B46C
MDAVRIDLDYAGPYQPPSAPGIAYRPQPVTYHGKLAEPVYPGRLVVDGDWPATRPEECVGEYPTQWIGDGQVLICTGCGLDCT